MTAKRLRLPFCLTCLLFLAGLLLAACNGGPTATYPVVTPSATPSPFVARTATGTPTPGPIRTQRSVYPTPQFTPITPIPPALSGLEQPQEVLSLALLGTDNLSPYLGRTDAIILVFYHPRFGRASLLSIPPDLFVYIPGYTMQRLNTAYAVGGVDLLADTLEYNLGVRPDDYAVVGLEAFVYLVDDLGGLEVTIAQPLPEICADLLPGRRLLDGDQVMCYLRFREGLDEVGRNLRQQEVFGIVLRGLLQGGALVRLPELYGSYRSSVQSSLGLDDLQTMVPFALRLGDSSHLGYFQLGGPALDPWQIPEGLKPLVLLPVQDEVLRQVQQAIDFVLTPEPNTDRILTLEYELTVSPTPTTTGTSTRTATATRTIPPTSTQPGTITPTRTRTTTGTPPTATTTGTITPATATTTGTVTPSTATTTTTVTP
jgi:LCP family protein required for cell wall assembly